MAYQLSGHEGAIASWGDNTSTVDYCYHLINTAGSVSNVKIAVMAEQQEVTSGSVSAPSAVEFRNVMRSWSFSGECFFPKAGAKTGAQGSVTFASGDVLWIDGYDIDITWPEERITRFGQSDTTWHEYRPQRFARVTGSFTGFVDSGTAASLPVPYTTAAAAATFKLTEDGSDDNVITGSIIPSALDIEVPITAGGLQRKAYKFAFSGAVTFKSTGTPGTNLIPASTAGVALAQSTWDKDGDGVADRTVSILLGNTSRTASGYAWLQRLGLSVRASELIKVAFTGRGSGPLALG